LNVIYLHQTLIISRAVCEESLSGVSTINFATSYKLVFETYCLGYKNTLTQIDGQIRQTGPTEYITVSRRFTPGD